MCPAIPFFFLYSFLNLDGCDFGPLNIKYMIFFFSQSLILNIEVFFAAHAIVDIVFKRKRIFIIYISIFLLTFINNVVININCFARFVVLCPVSYIKKRVLGLLCYCTCPTLTLLVLYNTRTMCLYKAFPSTSRVLYTVIHLRHRIQSSTLANGHYVQLIL